MAATPMADPICKAQLITPEAKPENMAGIPFKEIRTIEASVVPIPAPAINNPHVNNKELGLDIEIGSINTTKPNA